MPTRPDEIILHDEPEAGPYLPGETALLPLRLPLAPLTPGEFDRCLEAGDRRTGPLLYTTHCPRCQACEAIRLDVTAFVPSRTQARAFKRGSALFQAVVQAPRIDDERLSLFNRHRQERGLARDDRPDVDAQSYEDFLISTCCDTREIAYTFDGRLVMVAIVDVGRTSVSAVYTYFDPGLARLSPGVYSILYQVQQCRQWNCQWLYLGYYVAGSRHMTYKAAFRPHQRRQHGIWRDFA
jgi:arginine-tRNA-protein transferase